MPHPYDVHICPWRFRPRRLGRMAGVIHYAHLPHSAAIIVAPASLHLVVCDSAGPLLLSGTVAAALRLFLRRRGLEARALVPLTQLRRAIYRPVLHESLEGD